MSRNEPPRREQPDARRARLPLKTAAFWGYLVVLVIATHVPRVDASYLATVGRLSPLQPDKTLHLFAYAVLGGLAGWAFSGRSPVRDYVRLFVALACWGLVDELTQPLFGRGADFWDWCYDVVGLAVGLGGVVAWRRLADRRCRGGKTDAGA